MRLKISLPDNIHTYEIDVADELLFVQIINDFIKEQYSIMSSLGININTLEPSIYMEKTNVFDYWKSPHELGLHDGTLLLLENKWGTKGGGLLPLDLLHQYSELEKFLNDKHRGIQALFLYTEGDTFLCDFIQQHAYTELIQMSNHCIIYAPIKGILNPDQEYLNWWKNQYPKMDFHAALNFATGVYGYDKNIYDIVRSIGLSEEHIPCIVFFVSFPMIKCVIFKLEYTNNDHYLIVLLRNLFSIVNKINDSSVSLKDLKKELERFRKKTRIGNNYSFTLLSMSLVNIPHSIIGKIL